MRVAKDDFVQPVHLAFRRRSKALKHMSVPRQATIEMTEEYGKRTLEVRICRGEVAFSLICEPPRTFTFEVYAVTRRRMWKTFYKFRCERAWPNPKLIQRTFEDVRIIGRVWDFPHAVDEVYTTDDIARLDRMWGRLCVRSVASCLAEESATA